MTSTKQPKIAKEIGTIEIYHNRAFSFNIADAFSAKGNHLQYNLEPATQLPWLHFDAELGECFGDCPKFDLDKTFKLTAHASNTLGTVSQGFILKVFCTELAAEIEQTLEHVLSLRKQKYGFSHIHPYTPSLLEYLYHFYMSEGFIGEFENKLSEQARLINQNIKFPIKFVEFKALVSELNPQFEKYLAEHQAERAAGLEKQLAAQTVKDPVLAAKVEENHALTREALSNEQLEVLVRQGSQQLGVIAIPIFNYYGAPDQYNWTDWQTIDNVLDAASHQLAKLKQENTKQQNPAPAPNLQLKPKGL